MADCFTMPNAAELVRMLRDKADLDSYYYNTIEKCETVEWKAADAIEALLAKNARLKAERDAAVADLKQAVCVEDIPEPCDYCKYCWKSGNTGVCSIDSDCFKVLRWEWRGAQKEEEDGQVH